MADNVNQIIIETLVSGLSNQLQKLNDLEEELQGFEDQYSKDYKIVNDRLNDLNSQIDRTIKEAISKIEFPKSISEDEIVKLTKENINEIDEAQLKEDLNKQINIDIGKIKSELLQTIKAIEIPQGEKGERGESINDEQVQNAVSLWIEDNKDLLVGERGAKGERGIIGQQGQSGQDSVGIEDIKRDKDEIVFTLTDGTEKRITLPKQQTKFLGGGGGLTLQEATSTLIVSVNTDSTIQAISQNILVNATNGNINLTLPNPEGCLIRGRSYKIGITKIDNTNNKVILLPYNNETLSNEINQTLYGEGDVVNFITDGINWFKGS